MQYFNRIGSSNYYELLDQLDDIPARFEMIICNNISIEVKLRVDQAAAWKWQWKFICAPATIKNLDNENATVESSVAEFFGIQGMQHKRSQQQQDFFTAIAPITNMVELMMNDL